jgi:hypothetical protein
MSLLWVGSYGRAQGYGLCGALATGVPARRNAAAFGDAQTQEQREQGALAATARTHDRPLMGNALFAGCEDVVARPAVRSACALKDMSA